jgi:hypothetical protein
MLLIGVAGLARSGKGTVAQYVKDIGVSKDLKVVERGFADAVKHGAYRLFKPDCTMKEALIWQDSFKREGIVNVYGSSTSVSGREFLQRYGTEAHRELHGEDFWLNHLLPENDWGQIKENFDDADVGVIADMRFNNEARRILELGGTTWEVVRPILDGQDAHRSEAGVSAELVNAEIVNAGSLDELRVATEAVFNSTAEHMLQLRMEV